MVVQRNEPFVEMYCVTFLAVSPAFGEVPFSEEGFPSGCGLHLKRNR